MSETSNATLESDGSNPLFVDLGRAYGSAILFSFPILMTMEMWWQGFSMSATRLLIFTLVAIPLLLGLSYYDGFEDTFTFLDDIRETLIAYFVGITSTALMLYLFGVLKPEMSWDERIGKISVQAVTASLGAMFAQSLLGGGAEDAGEAGKRKRKATYLGQLFLTVVGALFLSMSVAPTEEMILIAFQMNEWHTLSLVTATLFVMHAFINAAERRGEAAGDSTDTGQVSLFVRYTLVGYAVVLAVSYYGLWTFGSLEGMAFPEQLEAVIVLGFPAGLGGSASRLIL